MVETKKTILEMCIAKHERLAAIVVSYECLRTQLSEAERQVEGLFASLLSKALSN